MKALYLLLLTALPALAATDSAYYRHHQRGTTAALETDLVNREIGIDSSKKCIVGKLSTGAAFHGVCQEQDTVNFSGVVNISGQANLTSVKASNYNSGSVLFFGTGGQFTEDNTNLAFNDATNTLTTLRLSLIDGGSILAGTSGGLKIATSTSQRLGFYNSTPIVQPSGTTDLRQALINLGLYATGGASPLNLNGGALTAAKVTSSDSVVGGAANFSGNFLTTGGAATFQAGNSAAEFDIHIKGSRGTVSSPSNVVNGDYPLTLTSEPYSGGTYFPTASINFAVDGTFTSGQRPPSRIEFYTNVANGPQVKQLSIAGNGQIVATAPITAGSTIDASGKVSSDDSVVAVAGFRAGNTAASNVILYRGSADKWRTPNSFQVDKILTADTLVSRKFYVDDTTIAVTLTGVSGTVSGAANLTRVGKLIVLSSIALSGTSNANTCTITGIPAALRPSASARSGVIPFQDNGTAYLARISIGTDGVITVYAPDGTTNGFTTSGTKGLLEMTTIPYSQGF